MQLLTFRNQKLRYSSLAPKLNNRTDTFTTAKLQINGHDRMAEKPAEYYRLVQNNRYMPGQTSKQIYTYSFALNPGEHQPVVGPTFPGRLCQVKF